MDFLNDFIKAEPKLFEEQSNHQKKEESKIQEVLENKRNQQEEQKEEFSTVGVAPEDIYNEERPDNDRSSPAAEGEAEENEVVIPQAASLLFDDAPNTVDLLQ